MIKTSSQRVTFYLRDTSVNEDDVINYNQKEIALVLRNIERLLKENNRILAENNRLMKGLDEKLRTISLNTSD